MSYIACKRPFNKFLFSGKLVHMNTKIDTNPEISAGIEKVKVKPLPQMYLIEMHELVECWLNGLSIKILVKSDFLSQNCGWLFKAHNGLTGEKNHLKPLFLENTSKNIVKCSLFNNCIDNKKFFLPIYYGSIQLKITILSPLWKLLSNFLYTNF